MKGKIKAPIFMPTDAVIKLENVYAAIKTSIQTLINDNRFIL